MHGFHPYQPAFKHRWGAKLLGATMWFWIFYRMKQDGPVLLVSDAGRRSVGRPRREMIGHGRATKKLPQLVGIGAGILRACMLFPSHLPPSPLQH